MTREEAIEIIRMAISEVEWDYPMDYAAAFDMAIEALKQEPCEDAVSREVVFNVIDNYGVSMEGNKSYENVVNGLVRATKIAIHKAIEELPSVTPTNQKRKGEQ